jgi:hypothetical protein
MVGEIETVKIGGTNTRYFSTGVSNLLLMCIFRQHFNCDQLHFGSWESLLALDFGCARLIIKPFGVHRAKYAVYPHLGVILAGDIHFHLVETPLPFRTASSIPTRSVEGELRLLVLQGLAHRQSQAGSLASGTHCGQILDVQEIPTETESVVKSTLWDAPGSRLMNRPLS